uniref:Secreted protein n=1 Tax=Poecilia mexicana TaxID=48701 RepID=A0A3B3XYG0_9TELE
MKMPPRSALCFVLRVCWGAIASWRRGLCSGSTFYPVSMYVMCEFDVTKLTGNDLCCSELNEAAVDVNSRSEFTSSADIAKITGRLQP